MKISLAAILLSFISFSAVASTVCRQLPPGELPQLRQSVCREIQRMHGQEGLMAHCLSSGKLTYCHDKQGFASPFGFMEFTASRIFFDCGFSVSAMEATRVDCNGNY